ncbi:MAG: DNA/RNA non-specific endonuclease [Verrucomicrobiaceae bacterium]|nr:DNA/RNA non-specific endonuclease [Verrucomicrobiaceae bacterium]
MQKIFTILFFLLVSITQSFCIVGISGDIDKVLYPECSENLIVLRNNSYVSGFSEKYGVPLWVAYLTQYPFKFASFRIGDFSEDIRLTLSPSPRDYSKTGYDRGHMAPAYAIGRNYGKIAQKKSFYMSNIVPQTPKLNRGVWKKTEQYIAKKLAKRYGEVLVIVGPVFSKDKKVLDGPLKTRDVFIPEYTFMVLKIQTFTEIHMMAFLMPQNPKSKDMWEYACSVRKIEKLTGLNFFSNYPIHVQNRLEIQCKFDFFKAN